MFGIFFIREIFLHLHYNLIDMTLRKLKKLDKIGAFNSIEWHEKRISDAEKELKKAEEKLKNLQKSQIILSE